MQKTPFTVAVPEATLTDLRERLDRVRWPAERLKTGLGAVAENERRWFR